MANSDRRHPNEKQLLAFLERKDISSQYVFDTVQWIKKEYPGSLSMLPKLREIYKQKVRANT